MGQEIRPEIKDAVISFSPPKAALSSLFHEIALETGDAPGATALLDEWYGAAIHDVEDLLNGQPDTAIVANDLKGESHTLTVRAPKKVLEALSQLNGAKIETRRPVAF